MTRRDYRPGEGPARGCTLALATIVAALLFGLALVAVVKAVTG